MGAPVLDRQGGRPALHVLAPPRTPRGGQVKPAPAELSTIIDDHFGGEVTRWYLAILAKARRREQASSLP